MRDQSNDDDDDDDKDGADKHLVVCTSRSVLRSCYQSLSIKFTAKHTRSVIVSHAYQSQGQRSVNDDLLIRKEDSHSRQHITIINKELVQLTLMPTDD